MLGAATVVKHSPRSFSQKGIRLRRDPSREFRTQTNTPATPSTHRIVPDIPASGYALVVDGQMKKEFDTGDAARSCAIDLKRRFPALQVKVFDAQSRRMETIPKRGGTGTETTDRPLSCMADELENDVAPAAIEKVVEVFETLQDRDHASVVQARKAATEHIFGQVASGQTDKQRLVVSGLSHLKSRERQAKAPKR
jgi:hypothetical protein